MNGKITKFYGLKIYNQNIYFIVDIDGYGTMEIGHIEIQKYDDKDRLFMYANVSLDELLEKEKLEIIDEKIKNEVVMQINNIYELYNS